MSGNKAFVDTNIFIYLIEENSLYLDKINKLLNFLEKNRFDIVTSTLTFGEILTKPYKDDRKDLIIKYERLFNEIELIDLNSEIAKLFAKIRVEYNIKTPDAIQLASALYSNAKLFITNDDALCRFKEGEVLLLKKFDGE